MYLTSYKRVKDQWVIDMAVTQSDWDTLSVGDVRYYGDGRQGIVSAKMDTPTSPATGYERYMTRGIRVAFPSRLTDRIMDPWQAGPIVLYDHEPGLGEVLKTDPGSGLKKAGDAVSDIGLSLWDSIPPWVKWGTLGAGLLYVAGPYLSRTIRGDDATQGG